MINDAVSGIILLLYCFYTMEDITFFSFFTPIVFYYNGLEMMMAISMKFYRLEYEILLYITFKPRSLQEKTKKN